MLPGKEALLRLWLPLMVRVEPNFKVCINLELTPFFPKSENEARLLSRFPSLTFFPAVGAGLTGLEGVESLATLL